MATIAVSYGGERHSITLDANTPPWAAERAICTACGVAWGCVLLLRGDSSPDPSIFNRTVRFLVAPFRLSAVTQPSVLRAADETSGTTYPLDIKSLQLAAGVELTLIVRRDAGALSCHPRRASDWRTGNCWARGGASFECRGVTHTHMPHRGAQPVVLWRYLTIAVSLSPPAALLALDAIAWRNAGETAASCTRTRPPPPQRRAFPCASAAALVCT